MPEQVYRGTVLAGENFEPIQAAVIVENGIITGIEEETAVPPVWISPAFFNAHTHLGDTVAMDCASNGGDLAALVTPPNGLKHRILAATPVEQLIAGMKASIRTMRESGTAGFADFREGGIEGVRALQEALEDEPCLPIIFGREGGEREAHGIGISSVRDVTDAEEQVRRARASGKLVAFHAGEKDPDDIDGALAYDPDLLVHCTHATRDQLRRIADAGIAIAVCVRSNWILGVTRGAEHPPLQTMADLGCTVYLGTDNVMFVQPDMLREMCFCDAVSPLPPEWILRAAVGGASLGGGRSFDIQIGNPAHFVLIDARRSALQYSTNPIASIVRRVGGKEILETVICRDCE
ncbi:amidohydrolase family protein [Methanofollis fontis]|uniref:Amidohydrolase n=1 Tax=Methanofollis fontis TaxID=2052832 RepID=A0A483CXP7_9EURY|nr:amidohydrolase family protein [Methanofollis fontis]TAJ44113.1 amidohydrolase [Methanofollis fontis]